MRSVMFHNYESCQQYQAKELEKTIPSMPSKTCTLDIKPTARLKEVLGTILPSVAHIVNKSLDQGVFYKGGTSQTTSEEEITKNCKNQL